MDQRNGGKYIIMMGINRHFLKYKEIEFVCVNTDTNSNTTIENQNGLYFDLKKVDGLLPYIQDWSNNNNIQRSLAVIILEDINSMEIIKHLADIWDIEIDLYNEVDEKKVNDIIKGDLENLVSDNDIKPYTEKINSDGIYIRKFSEKIDQVDLVWHKDKEDRIVKSINNTDWKLQLDNKIPESLNNEVFIPKNTYHRLIKGNNNLELKIDKSNTY